MFRLTGNTQGNHVLRYLKKLVDYIILNHSKNKKMYFLFYFYPSSYY